MLESGAVKLEDGTILKGSSTKSGSDGKGIEISEGLVDLTQTDLEKNEGKEYALKAGAGATVKAGDNTRTIKAPADNDLKILFKNGEITDQIIGGVGADVLEQKLGKHC